MASSGSITLATGSYGTRLVADWVVERQNVEGNYSTLYVNYRLYGNKLSFTNETAITISATYAAQGVSKSFSTRVLNTYSSFPIGLGSQTVQVNHAVDGTGQALITGSFSYTGYTTGTSYTSGSGRGWATLDTIPRQATILTAPNFNDEENPTITYNNPLGEDAASLAAAISFDGTTPDIDYRDIDKSGTEYTFNLTEAERNILRAGTTGSNTRKVWFYVRTVIGETFYFSYKEATFTIINGAPTIEASVIDTNSATTALTGDVSTLIRYHSTASASFSVYPQKEATITSKRIEHNGGFTTEYVATYPNVGGNTFAFIATDNRGNTVEKTIVSPMIDYIRPTVNINTEQKMDTTGYYNLRCAGNYFNDTFGYTDAATANTLTVSFRYKAQGGTYGSWEQISASIDGNTYTAQAFINGLDYRTTYVFQCRIIDKLNTVLSAEITVKSIPIFHWSGDDFTFEVPVNFKQGATGIEGGSTESGGTIDNIDGDLTITGNLRMKGSGNYGNTIYFGDSSYAYITETTDDDITIKATDINLQGNVYINGTAYSSGGGSTSASDTEYGEWTPTLAASNYISYYDIQRGWYQKVGNVITIGWMIKATTTSGGIGTAVRINGVPYTPAVAAFGGGIAHNVYMPGNFTFTGWSIDDSGVISARGQSCNKTGAANHEITSTVCYATSGTLMTLSGTICYMV